MLQYFFDFQAGFVDPKIQRRVEITRRSYNLQLSRHQDVANVHSAGVNSLNIDSESRHLLSGCSDGSLYIHDLYNFSGKPHYTAKCLCSIPKGSKYAHSYSISCVTWYSSDNGLFLTSGTDKILKIWDTNYLKPVETFKSKGRIMHHELTDTHSSYPLVAVGSTMNLVELFDLRTGSSTHQLRGHQSSILACAWSPRNLLATGGIDNKILMWDIRSSDSCLLSLDRHNSNSNTGTAHSGFVNGLKFTSDGLLLISYGTDNRIRLWETLNGNHQMINYGKIKNGVKKHVQFDITNGSNPPLIYVPSEGNVNVLELFTGKLVNALYGHFNLVNCCTFYQDCQILISGGSDHNVLMWVADETDIDVENNEKKVVKNPLIRMSDTWSSDED